MNAVSAFLKCYETVCTGKVLSALQYWLRGYGQRRVRSRDESTESNAEESGAENCRMVNLIKRLLLHNVRDL